ncbi:plastocyanin/azurin family copper-binding protein [Cognaticolwellia mytili]|uniref:plastocyanin/azurin family copper-binding protein n=1 Tax=Cognaticolwellia mytili TaxID=1888913 RepID=UPI000A172040|nr:plastocyanin/azurin family copper-binding protein [Cognaticolwellia mytili]
MKKVMTIWTIALAVVLAIALNATAYAKNHQVKLLTSDDNGQNMIMSPGYLKIALGDSVTFIPADPSHNVESISIPEKAAKFVSPMGQKYSHTFNVNGVYLYKCTPHFVLGMWGVIQVGDAENIEQVNKDWSTLSTGVAMNKARVSAYLSQVK